MSLKMIKIQPYREENVVYDADTCAALINAADRKKIELNRYNNF